MKTAEWLILLGGVLLLTGLFLAFWSSRLESRVMGKTKLGMAVFAPEPASPAFKEKERLRWWADVTFWVGIGLTAIGVALQTLGGIWTSLVE